MLRYRVGDKVLIKKEIQIGYCGFEEKMAQYCGRVATITGEVSYFYRIDLDKGEFSWSESFFRVLPNNGEYIEKSYNKGLIDSWNIINYINECDECFQECFPGGREELFSLDIQEIIGRVEKYKERKEREREEIRVGDEVFCCCWHRMGVVTAVDYGPNKNELVVINKYGFPYISDDADRRLWERTGRFFDVEEILNKIGK